MDAEVISNLPIDNILDVMSQRNAVQIKELCNANEKLKSICDNKENWNKLVEFVLIRVGFEDEDIEKLNKNKFKNVYDIISYSNPEFNDSSHHEMLAYSLVYGDDELVKFFKDYFFIGDKQGKFRKDDSRELSRLVERYIREKLQRNETWDSKVLKITDLKGNSYTILPKLSEANLMAAIKRGDISDTLNILKLAEKNGTPFFKEMVMFLNLADSNFDMIGELLHYSFANDYFVGLDSLQNDLVDEITNPDARKFVKNWLIEIGYLEESEEQELSEIASKKSEQKQQEIASQESEQEQQEIASEESEPELSEQRLIAAIKKGDITEAIQILELADSEGVPFFHEMVSYINEAGDNINMIRELLYYSFSHDYFIGLDSLQEELVDEITNPIAQKFIKNYLVERGELEADELEPEEPIVQKPEPKKPKTPEEPIVQKPEPKKPEDLSKMSIQLLPVEIVLEIMKTLSPDAVKNLCSTNPDFVDFCKQNWNYIVKKVVLNAGYPELTKNSNLKYTDIYKVIQKANPKFEKDKELQLLAYAKLELEPTGELYKYFEDFVDFRYLEEWELKREINKIVCKKMEEGEYVPLFKLIVKDSDGKDQILDPKDIPDLVEYIKNKVDNKQYYDFIIATEEQYSFEDCAKKGGLLDNLKQTKQYSDYLINKEFIQGQEERKTIYTSDRSTYIYDEIRDVSRGVIKTNNPEILEYVLSNYKFENNLKETYEHVKQALKDFGLYDKYQEIISPYIKIKKDKDDKFEEDAIELIKNNDLNGLKRMKKILTRPNISIKRLIHFAKQNNKDKELIDFLKTSSPYYSYADLYNL